MGGIDLTQWSYEELIELEILVYNEIITRLAKKYGLNDWLNKEEEYGGSSTTG